MAPARSRAQSPASSVFAMSASFGSAAMLAGVIVPWWHKRPQSQSMASWSRPMARSSNPGIACAGP